MPIGLPNDMKIEIVPLDDGASVTVVRDEEWGTSIEEYFYEFSEHDRHGLLIMLCRIATLIADVHAEPTQQGILIAKKERS